MSRIDIHNYEIFLLDYSEGNLSAEDVLQLKTFVMAHPELDIDLEDLSLPSLPEENYSFGLKQELKKTEDNLVDETVLNYLEGQMSASEREVFERTLSEDEALVKELEAYKKSILSADPGVIPEFRSELYKTEDDLVLMNRSIAYVENQLTTGEKAQFEKELKTSPELVKELSLVSKTILPADTTVVYPDKASLKKKGRVIVLFSFRTMSAAAAAILLLIGFAIVLNYTASEKTDLPEIARVNKPADKQALPDTNLNEKLIVKEMPLTVDPGKIGADRPMAAIHTTEQTKHINKESSPLSVQESTTTPVEKQVQELPLANHTAEKETLQNVKKEELALLPKNNVKEDSLKQYYLLESEEIEEGEDILVQAGNRKKGFWKRAVQLAKQANKLGVKSIDGQENSENTYRLSFNSFSVEKK